MVHIGCTKICIRPKRNLLVARAVAKEHVTSAVHQTNSVGHVSSKYFTELARDNERLFKRFLPSGNSRHPEECDGRGRRLVAGPGQFRTRAIHSLRLFFAPPKRAREITQLCNKWHYWNFKSRREINLKKLCGSGCQRTAHLRRPAFALRSSL